MISKNRYNTNGWCTKVFGSQLGQILPSDLWDSDNDQRLGQIFRPKRWDNGGDPTAGQIFRPDNIGTKTITQVFTDKSAVTRSQWKKIMSKHLIFAGIATNFIKFNCEDQNIAITLMKFNCEDQNIAITLMKFNCKKQSLLLYFDRNLIVNSKYCY